MSKGFACCCNLVLLAAFPALAQTPTQGSLVSAKQTCVYKTVGDCNIHADVFRPADKTPRPVILWLHGGALIWGSRTRIHAEQLTRYVGEGFASAPHKVLWRKIRSV
jgi:carboxylesterase type B